MFVCFWFVCFFWRVGGRRVALVPQVRLLNFWCTDIINAVKFTGDPFKSSEPFSSEDPFKDAFGSSGQAKVCDWIIDKMLLWLKTPTPQPIISL